ncbi:AraC family transcriptional regulator [Sinirhodobacter populi]|uniref:AraC family transcriptional regulator n=1 Tax=Paenirhodobacter populi TaxID=2306993 RepID=A0A443K0P1_9RHOB|nr:AraC family transcriptional regulator [Sinirhodobacter populi]
MTVTRYPGNFRIGVLDGFADGVGDSLPCRLDPKFQILVLLAGRQVFHLDHHRIELDAETGPHAVMMHLTRSCTLRYAGSWGDPFRKIALACDCDWINQLMGEDGTRRGLLESPLGYVTWRPDTEIARLAVQIVAPPPTETTAQANLFRMSRGLEILRRCLTDHLPCGAPPTADPVAETIRLYLNRHLGHDLSLPRMESDLGLNRRSIQRHFTKSFGCTLRDYVRTERMARAHRALAEEGASVHQAAHLAGYGTVANFSTAFRRIYGVPPKDMRNRSI